ncbi:hypothetical protein NQZ68_003969, partial [Dissostichus eleginoides]
VGRCVKECDGRPWDWRDDHVCTPGGGGRVAGESTEGPAVLHHSVSQGEASLVPAREGASAELSCNLSPPSKEFTTPNLFPLHVVEWVRLGYNVPILIKFGVYAPRVHPNYKGNLA